MSRPDAINSIEQQICAEPQQKIVTGRAWDQFTNTCGGSRKTAYKCQH